jgi:hypothetical protein
MTAIDDKMPSLHESFDGRHAIGVAWELTLKGRLEQRGWEVTLTGAERHYSPGSLAILRRRRANLGGPDMVATLAPDLAYAIDAKTALPRPDGSQFLPGLAQFTINERALDAMQAFVSSVHVPGLFVLDDDAAGVVVTPLDVRSKGIYDKRGFWYVCAVHGKPLSDYFGALPAGAAEYRWAGEYPGDFPLAAAG